MLDEALKSIKPDVSLFISVCLHNRDANDVHESLHKVLF